jgi:hypothetical protein
MEQNYPDYPGPEQRIIAIVSDATVISLMDMDNAGAYFGVVTEDFPAERWNQVSRVMNFVVLGTHDRFIIDEENIVTFSWEEVRIIINRQNLHLDRGRLRENVPEFEAAPVVEKKRRFGRKKKPDCGCGG